MDRTEEVRTKLDSVLGWLERSGHGAALFRSQANFAWLTAGGRDHVSIGEEAGIGWVLVGPTVAQVLTTNIEHPRLLDEEIGDLPIDVLDHPWHDPAKALVQARAIARAGSIVTDLPIGSRPRIRRSPRFATRCCLRRLTDTARSERTPRGPWNRPPAVRSRG
ncbi:MAG: hypothetical protein M3O88_01340 [Actinomycetota bacterium]|nr:hypothetical protein [Actinomycetota bacterium]